MPTDEEMIAAVRAMTPEELNTYVAMKLGGLEANQAACNKSCLERLRLVEDRMQANEKQFAKLSGWMKGIWLIIGGIVAALIGILVAFTKGR